MTFTGYRMDETVERRIGRRVRAPDLPVAWAPPRSGGLRLRRGPRTWPGHVENVSLTGAAVSAPDDLPVEVGDAVVLEWEGLPNRVRVRWVEPTDEPGLVRYGVELVAVHPGLRSEIHRLLDETPAER